MNKIMLVGMKILCHDTIKYQVTEVISRFQSLYNLIFTLFSKKCLDTLIFMKKFHTLTIKTVIIWAGTDNTELIQPSENYIKNLKTFIENIL